MVVKVVVVVELLEKMEETRSRRRSPPGAGVVAVGIELAGGELVEARSISNLAFKVPPTVVKDSDAEDPAALAC